MAQYAGQRVYGDIYSVPTTAVDNIAKRIIAEKQQRDLQQRQDNKMLDDEFGKNLAKVKSVDIPEITSAYNDYKQAYIGLMKKGNKATPQDHMDVMLKKANANEKINGSVEDKEYLKFRATEGKADKRGRYNPNFNKIIYDQLNTPTSKRNRDKDDELLLNQYSFPDLEKVSANMIGGKPTEIKLPTGQKSIKGDLYDDENVYQRFNHPNKMYENAYLDVSKRADRDAYENIVLNSLNDKEKEDLKTRYFAKVNSPEFKAIYGEVQPFPESAGQTELGQAVALSVMSAVDKLPIQPLRTESKLNSEAAMAKRRKEGMEDWDYKNNKVYLQSLNKIAANKQAGLPFDSGVGYPTEELANAYGEDMDVTKPGGQKVRQRVIFIDKADPVLVDMIRGFVKGKSLGVEPISFKGGRQGFIYNPGTKDLEGANGQMVSGERVRRDLIDNIVNTKFKVEAGKKTVPSKNKQKGELDDL